MNSRLSYSDFPLVTVAAICYNHEQFVLETLKSILNQTYDNIQLIIIDDCSRDKSVSNIQNWLTENRIECSFIAHVTNKGICKTLNESIQISNGKYFQGIACDDVLEPYKIEMMVKSLEQSGNDIALIYSDMSVINEKGEIIQESILESIKRNPQNMPEGDVFLEELMANFIMAPTVMFKTSILKKEGGYDETLIFEDYDMFLRITRHHKIKYLNDSKTVRYRKLDSSHSQILGVKIFETNLQSYYKLYYQEQDQAYRTKIQQAIYCTTNLVYKYKNRNSRYLFLKYLKIKFSCTILIRYLILWSNVYYLIKYAQKGKKKIRKLLGNKP